MRNLTGILSFFISLICASAEDKLFFEVIPSQFKIRQRFITRCTLLFPTPPTVTYVIQFQLDNITLGQYTVIAKLQPFWEFETKIKNLILTEGDAVYPNYTALASPSGRNAQGEYQCSYYDLNGRALHSNVWKANDFYNDSLAVSSSAILSMTLSALFILVF